MLDPDSSTALADLVAKGVGGTLFLETDDCQASYEELSARGVTFTEDEIQEAPWGRWKTFTDPDGNGWVLQQNNPSFPS